VFLNRRKKREMKVDVRPTTEGIRIQFFLQEGNSQREVQIPLTAMEIEACCRLPGFQAYVAWEELYDQQCIRDGQLPYDVYYQLLAQEGEDVRDIFYSLGIPVRPMEIKGRLALRSLPDQADLSLTLYDAMGRNLDKISKRTGAIYEIQGAKKLLPEKVYRLCKAVERDYEQGYAKIAHCQRLALESDIELENFLQTEEYHIVDHYEPEIIMHAPDHLEIGVKGEGPEQTRALGAPQPVTSFAEGNRRRRYVKTEQVSNDLSVLRQKRHTRKFPSFFKTQLPSCRSMSFCLIWNSFQIGFGA